MIADMTIIPNHPGYFATPEGQIVSIKSGEPLVLKQRIRDGYWFVTLHSRVGKKRKAHRAAVHRLVLLAFQGPPPSTLYMARHLDGNRANSRASNLAWGTAKENYADAIRHGTQGPGMRAPRRRLSECQVREIRRRLAAGESCTELALQFGVSRYYPSDIARRLTWSSLP
jgi:hypothetical protein